MTRRLLASTGIVALAFALTGCEVRSGAEITLDGDTTRITVTLHATGEVADRLAEEPMRGRLVGAVAEAAASSPEAVQVDVGPGSMRVTVPVTYEQLTTRPELTGVRAAALDGAGEQRTVTVALVTPQRLADAVVLAAAGQPDSVAVAAAMAGNTHSGITVTFAGGDATATFSPDNGATSAVAPSCADGTCRFHQPLSHLVPGTLEVTGNASGGGNSIVVFGAGAIVAVVVVSWAAAADRRRRALRALGH